MKIGIIIGAVVICCITIMIAIRLLSKEFSWYLKTKNILMATFFVIYFSLSITYLIALFFKRVPLPLVEQVGTADAWIGFAGSALGGVITMLALYFTLKQTEEQNKTTRVDSIKPFISCDITNIDEEERKIIMTDYINNYDFIKFKMSNISSNIANGIKIIDEYSLIQEENGKFRKYDDLYDDFGISIYTVSLNDGFFLAPNGEYNWNTNFAVDLHEDDTYMWEGPAFEFTHILIFQYTDVSNLQTYKHKFEFVININIDVENKLHFFLENISNTIETASD